MQRAAKLIVGTQLNTAQVDIIFSLFKVDSDSDDLDPEQLASAIVHSNGRGPGQDDAGGGTRGESLVGCMLGCCGWLT